ncbi:MAG: hypothetical protein K6G04_00155 [Lachnospiraceae bacterium]|nr:hypothetical protein [Lachnospiraceae bacterium]
MNKVVSYVITGISTIIFGVLLNYLMLPAWNIHSKGLPLFFVFVLLFGFFMLSLFAGRPVFRAKKNHKNGYVYRPFEVKAASAVGVGFICMGIVLIILLWVLGQFISSRLFHATAYSQILQVTDGGVEDIPSADKTDAIALMDTASATKLGDREIGSLSDLVSQYEIYSDDYTQVNLGNEPVKVAPLSYAGLFKWNNNKAKGVPGYVSVSPVNMDAKYVALPDGMVYVPSAYFSQDLERHIRFAYPTTLFGNVHFEVDEEGNPWYVASTYKYTIGLYGGKTVSGAILINPVNGEMQKYSVADVPQWVDVVFPGTLICNQYNDYAQLQRGYWNSVFGQNGCRKVTEYSSDDEDDDSPKADYGYIAKDDDIWIYTGITSVNGDSSNIGFIVANERTGVTKFIEASGADEFSAMSAAEGEVQEKGYQASFPSLITVEDVPTYIMVLKDKSGLVKMYACVNVAQYNIVATAGNQDDCIAKYQALLQGKITAEQATGEATPVEVEEADSVVDTTNFESRTVTVAKLQTMDIDGNTYLYIVDSEGNVYKARYADVEDMLFVNEGDEITIETDGETYRYSK